jgi:hypothetical protein
MIIDIKFKQLLDPSLRKTFETVKYQGVLNSSEVENDDGPGCNEPLELTDGGCVKFHLLSSS